jgi:hypothetical protein
VKSGLGERLGGNGREDSSGFATHLLDAGWIFQGAGGALETEVQGFLLQLLETDLEFVGGKLAGCFTLDDLALVALALVAAIIQKGMEWGLIETDQACGLRATRRVRMPSL